jgi:hypothetical protein
LNDVASVRIDSFMLRHIVIVTAILAIPASSSAAADARYALRGTSHVKTSQAPISVDKNYETTMRAKVTGESDARVELTGDGMNCALKGKRTGDVVALTPGQKCNKHVDDDGVRGDLVGTLVRGSLKLTGDKVTLNALWTFDGKVKFLFSHSDVKGTIDSNLKGTRVY